MMTMSLSCPTFLVRRLTTSTKKGVVYKMAHDATPGLSAKNLAALGSIIVVGNPACFGTRGVEGAESRREHVEWETEQRKSS